MTAAKGETMMNKGHRAHFTFALLTIAVPLKAHLQAPELQIRQ